jgi:hypothetical protein
MIMKQIVLLLAVLSTGYAHAEERGAGIPLNPVYKKECGSCHAPFPSWLLNAGDWKKTMSGLERHFGTDASLDPRTHGDVSAWLARNAGRGMASSGSAEPRLTQTRWFIKEHDEVPVRLWKTPKIQTPANCIACHKGADQGRYAESEISVPGMARREHD